MTAAAMVLCGFCAVPSPRSAAAASTNAVQRGIVVVRAIVTARGAIPGGSAASGEGPAEAPDGPAAGALVVAGPADGFAAGALVIAGLEDGGVIAVPVIAGSGDPLDGNGSAAPICTSA